MKGIVLAGGHGTRLHPLTTSISKQILPVYNKPMISYPVSVLMMAGISDIIVISSPEQIHHYKNFLKDGSQLGVNFTYLTQSEPRGLADAFLVAKDHIQDSPVMLVLGDNIFFGSGLHTITKNAINSNDGATIFTYQVSNPSDYGVAEFSQTGKVVDIEEKPKKPKTNWAVTGLYVYDKNVVEYASKLTPSSRGELEITDLNNAYLQRGKLHLEKLGRGYAWLDTGTPDSLLDAALFIKTVEKRQGVLVGCLEEVAYRFGFIDKSQLKKLIGSYGDVPYTKYLREVLLFS